MGRALLPVLYPLWHELARPAIISTVRARLKRREGEAGLLAVLCENEERASDVWLPLVDHSAATLVRSLAEQVAGAAWNWTESAHPHMSDLYDVLKHVQGKQSAAEILAKAIDGTFGPRFMERARNNPDALVKQEARQKLRGETSRLRAIDNTDGSFELSLIEQLTCDRPTPIETLMQRETDAPLDAPERMIQQLLNRAPLPRRQRQLLMLLRQNPTQSDNALARRLKVSRKTVQRWRTSLQNLLT
jgi:hypothetical protein